MEAALLALLLGQRAGGKAAGKKSFPDLSFPKATFMNFAIAVSFLHLLYIFFVDFLILLK